ncbi:activin receptor type-1-like [Brevipalpus obovatus]|uniref:activin receptor type-1-like n=1 Tax=Brevipalpus obovatus TaxID=246614 RepID=UPI003D9F9247
MDFTPMPMHRPRKGLLRCHCRDDHCDESSTHDWCDVPSGGYCFTMFKHSENTVEYGCFPSGERGLMACRGTMISHHEPKTVLCCKEHFCNRILKPNLTTVQPDVASNVTSTQVVNIWPIAVIALLVLLFTVILILLITTLVTLYKLRQVKNLKNKVKREKSVDHNSPSSSCLLFPCFRGTKGNRSLCHSSSTTSLGTSECPLVSPKVVRSGDVHHFKKTFELLHPIGHGRFGDIYKARTSDSTIDFIAVRYFTSPQLWSNEVEVYKRCRFTNIAWLVFYQEISPFYCLGVKFYPDGSLADFLKSRPLDEYTMLRLMNSLACCLVYLHAPIKGHLDKPSIAHLNLKSSNVMIYDGLECIISDFAMSIVEPGARVESLPHTANCDQKDKKYLLSNKPSMAPGFSLEPTSCRYFAPEILMSPNYRPINFEEALRADVYSFALIIWETAEQTFNAATSIDSSIPEHKLPYQTEIGLGRENRDSMRKLVCEQVYRPIIPEKWYKYPIFAGISQILRESWHPNPSARLPIVRIKKDLSRLLSTFTDQTEKNLTNNDVHPSVC